MFRCLTCVPVLILTFLIYFIYCLVNLSQAVAVAVPGDEVAGGAGAEPEVDGACGWSKPQMSLELMCRGQTDV